MLTPLVARLLDVALSLCRDRLPAVTDLFWQARAEA